MIAYADSVLDRTAAAVPSAPVVVGVDGSRPALHAVAWAAAEAALGHRRLEIVHVADAGAADGGAGIVERARTTAAATARRLERDLAVTTIVTCASPPDELTWFSARAHLLVVGYRGTGRLVAHGSTPGAVARMSMCPTVVVRATPAWPEHDRKQPVVVGADGSRDSAGAVRFAAAMAARRACPLVAVHAGNLGVVAAYGLLAECLDSIEEDHPGLDVRVEAAPGPVVSALLAWSSTAQLLVVGRRGTGRLAELALGSTSAALVRHSACPLAVVRDMAVSERQLALAAASARA